jgi:integral membrane sensor domain MASE1
MQETIKVAADKLKDTLKAVIREGNVRRIVVRNADGRTLLDMPIAAGVVGAVLAPFWMAIAGIVMLAKEFTVVIERDPDKVVKVSE